ncbi:MAG: protocatechuate 3,4-dioxygenase [Rhizobiales bacterium]|nr:protocatechuate 3,4-dioxygenase [Hyphomicrobiales bacterium]
MKAKADTGLTGLAGWTGLRPALAALTPTVRQTEGPFYPREQDLFADRDNDLVKIRDRVIEAGGEILYFRGIVKDTKGHRLSGARVEIWQCDANGRYLHGADKASGTERDGGFQGFGSTRTDADGRFSFRTIKPVSYPGRTPHIHAKFFHPVSNNVLTTQYYIDGDPQNDRDGLYRRLPTNLRAQVTMKLVANDAGEWQTDIEAVL